MVDSHTVTDILSLQKVRSLRRGSRVSLALPCLTDEESDRLENRLNRLVSECGCSPSACALIAGVAVCALFDATHRVTVAGHLFAWLGANLLLCVTAAALGRAAGLLRAKWKLARTVAAIRFRLSLARVEEDREPYAFLRRTSRCPDA